MIDNAIENGLSPGGCSAKLLHHWNHALVQCLEIESIPLAICPAFGHFFSEKFFGDHQIRADGVSLYVQPELGALRLNDVNVSPVDGTHTARGRLSILLELIWDEHGLFRCGCESCLPGKFGDEISNAIMSASVKPLGATRRVSSVGVENVWALLALRGGSATLLSRARGRIT